MKAIDAEGLFRINGATREVDELQKQFDKGKASPSTSLLRSSSPTIDLRHYAGKKVDFSKVKDPHVVAGVTKAWVR